MGQISKSRKAPLRFLLVTSAVFMTSFVFVSSNHLSASASTVTGLVFQDFNSNGVRDTAITAGQATDIGVAGIAVDAYDSRGTRVGTGITASDGTYTLSISNNASSDLRIEFTIPSSNPLSAFRSSFAGSNSGTSVQFVSIGATNVDYAINVPGEFCQNNPNLSVSRLCAGANNISGAASAWVTQYNGGPFTTAHGWTDVYNNWNTTKVAVQSETGSILGMAWDPTTRRIYHSAYIRRHALMYERNNKAIPGAIFVSTPNGTAASPGVGGATSFLVDLEDLLVGDQFSNSNSAGPGFVPNNAARKLQYFNDGTLDGGAENDGVDSDLVTGQDGVFEEVGRAGIGDIATDGKGNLYVVSLYDKNLYKVTLPASGAPTSMVSMGNITSGVTCINGEGRPFSVKVWRDELYLGVVCDASGDFDAANPRVVANTNLSFMVRKYGPATSTWSTFFGPHPLNTAGRIQKGRASTLYYSPTFDSWNPWNTTYADTYPVGSYDLRDYATRPQPMLSEIEFDRDGSMIVAFRDRNADIMGAWQSEAPDGTSSPYAAFASGDIYRVCRTGNGYAASDYTFEGVAGCQPSPIPSHLSNSSAVTNQGVEYYWGDFWWKTDQTGHGETSVGLTALAPGFPDLYLSTFDPNGRNNTYRTYYSGGIRSLLNSTGGPSGSPNPDSGVIFFASSWTDQGGDPNPNTLGGFGKVNGMSDIEVMCDQAPLQIGNRIWIDTDRDGIQDANETPVAGVTVHLYAADGTTLLGTAVTDASGLYYFASNVTEASAGTGDNVGGGIAPGSAYVIRLDNASDFTGSGPLAPYQLTTTTSTDSVTSLDTSVDNNASMVNSFPQLTTAVLQAGVNDHTYDIGFYNPAVSPNPILVGMGNYTWIDADKDGKQDKSELPLSGVVVELYNPDGTPALNASGARATATTDAKGYYFIDNLYPGSYYAKFILPANYTFTTRSSVGSTSENDSNPDVKTGITPVFSIEASVSGDTVTDTDSKTIASYVNPTIDAGVIPVGSVSVGDYVWRDRNGDGLQGKADTGVKGAVLTLTTANGLPVTDIFGMPVKSIKTKSNGKFLFANLPPGEYVVKITYPWGFIPTTANRPGRGMNSSTRSVHSKVLANGESDRTLDFGMVYRPLWMLPATL